MKRKALIIGINDYNNIDSLRWCENDAIKIDSALSRHASGDPNFSTHLFTTNAQIPLNQFFIEDQIQKLFSGDADVALLYFAGHGGFDEAKSEGIICSQDYYPRRGGAIKISDILNWANESDIRNKIIILDSCNSGIAGKDRNIKSDCSIIGDGITILTACTEKETAQENSHDQHGLFTGLLLEGLYGGAVNILGQVTPGSLYSFIDNALNCWEQRPVFKTNVSKFISLRDNLPLIEKSILRELPKWFEDPTDIYPLDPSYEPDRQNVPEQYRHLPVNEKNVETFKKLQKCNRYGLIVPSDAEHMYYAAIESKGCKLTALGAYYRKVCLQGNI